MAKKSGKSPEGKAEEHPQVPKNSLQEMFKASPAGSNSLVMPIGEAPKVPVAPQTSSGGIFPLPASSPTPLPMETQQGVMFGQNRTAQQAEQSMPSQSMANQPQQVSMFASNNNQPTSNIFGNNPMAGNMMGAEGGGLMGGGRGQLEEEVDESEESGSLKTT